MPTRIYNFVIGVCDHFVPKPLRPMWEHPAGPKTIFFWAPSFKWGLVFAGLGDLITRPVAKLSANQVFVLALSGCLWARWSLIIIPKNYNLCSCNVFVASINIIQLIRIYNYHHQEKAKLQSKKKP